MKITDYSDAEKRAVFDDFFGGTSLTYDRVSDEDMLKMIDTYNGSLVILWMRFKNLVKLLIGNREQI